MSELSRAEARERGALLTLDRYSVSLDLSTAPGTGETFVSDTTVTFDVAGEAPVDSFIDFIADSLERVEINGQAQDASALFDGSRVRLLGLRPGRNSVRVRGLARYSRSGEGLHRFVDPADAKIYLYTHYEPTDARRVFANFDQPDLKASFVFRIKAPAAWEVRSNTVTDGFPEPGRAATGGADSADITTLTWTFAPTARLSSYITCVAAGPYTSYRDTWSQARGDGDALTVQLGVLVRASLAPHADPEEIFALTKQGLDYFHEHFGVDYPWGKYDQVFVPEYNIGAMENPGLVTFTDNYIFSHAVTASDYSNRANTILHEMAHMWFGDLVTMQWWDDLWLKESFADYMGALALAEATKHKDAWVKFAARRKAWAYRQDQYPTTHPIVADIPDVAAAKLNFDGITYAKGASALKQLAAYVGREAFFEAAREYFRIHAWGTTTLADFLAVVERAAPERNVRAWADAWLTTTGVSALVPVITSDERGVITDFVIRQRDVAPDTGEQTAPRPHRLQIGSYDLSEGRHLRRSDLVTVDLTGEETRVDEFIGRRRPALVLVNDEDLTYAKVQLDEESLATVERRLGSIDRPLARALVWSMLWNQVRDGELAVSRFLDVVGRHLGNETNAGIVATVSAQVVTAVDDYLPSRGRSARLTALLGALLDSALGAEPGSDQQLAMVHLALEVGGRIGGIPGVAGARNLRPEVTAVRQLMAAIVAAPEPGEATPDGPGEEDDAPQGAAHAARDALDLADPLASFDGLVIDNDLRWRAIISLVGLGLADWTDIHARAAIDKGASGRLKAAVARAAVPLPIVKQRAWQSVAFDESLSNDSLSAIAGGLMAPGGRGLLEPYVGSYFEQLLPWWEGRSIEIAERLVDGLFPDFVTEIERVIDLAERWLDDYSDAPAPLRRMILEHLDDSRRRKRVLDAGLAALTPVEPAAPPHEK